MPANFLEAKTEILQYAKRDISDTTWASLAGGIINESIIKLQRLLPNLNALGKVTPGLTYTGGEKTVSLTDVIESTDINKIMAVHITSNSTNWEGDPLRIYTYEQLTAAMQQWEENKVRQEYEAGSTYNTYADYVTSVFGHFAFTLGTDIGLYPTPSDDKTLSVHYTPWLKALSDDTDTNLLLQYCWEFILYASLVRLNLILSEGDRLEISGQLLNITLAEVKNWNRSLAYSNPVEL